MKVATRSQIGTGPVSFPAQAVSQARKETAEWQQACMDHFDMQSASQSREKYDIWRNYRVASGDVDLKDYQYYTDPLSLGANKNKEYGTTFDIVHFPIMNAPLQTILGERIKRPINYTVKNETPRARNQEQRVKTDLLRDWVIGTINQSVQARVQQKGVDPKSQQGQQLTQQLTPEAIQDYMDKDYIDVAQQAGQRIIDAVYKDNVLDDEFVDGFRHATISAREFYHTYVCGGKIKVKNLSPMDVFYHRSPSVKWISEGQFAGFRLYLTPSSVIDLFYDDLSYEDIQLMEGLVNPAAKMMVTKGSNGVSSIHYDTATFSDFHGNMYEDRLRENLSDMIVDYQKYGDRSNYFNTYGLIKVVKAYWKSYRKIGFLTYYDQNGKAQKTVVDDNYQPNKQLGEHVEWKVINQVYEGCKVDDNIYLPVRPYKDAIFDMDDLEYCPLPIEGCTYNDTHSKPISMVDLMKPINELYDIIAYELKKDMNSALGKVLFMSVDHIPDMPGFTQEKWYYWAKELKIAWVKQPPRGGNTFNQFSAADMSFADQILAKMQTLSQLKAECEAFAGFSQSRIGSATGNTATETTQSAMASINQTEYYFFKHFKLAERILNYVLRLSRYVVREYDTYDYLFDDMELAYMKQSVEGFGSDKLRLYISNTLEDLQNKQKLDGLLQLAVSNGADIMDAGDILLARTVSETKTIFQRLKRKQQEAQQAQQQHEKDLQDAQLAAKKDDQDFQLRKQREMLASQEEQTYIKTFGLQQDNMKDTDGDGAPDVLEYHKFHAESEQANRKMLLEERKQYMSEVFTGKELQQKDKEIANKRYDSEVKLKVAAKNKNRYDKK
jgi:hypothetical protein